MLLEHKIGLNVTAEKAAHTAYWDESRRPHSDRQRLRNAIHAYLDTMAGRQSPKDETSSTPRPLYAVGDILRVVSGPSAGTEFAVTEIEPSVVGRPDVYGHWYYLGDPHQLRYDRGFFETKVELVSAELVDPEPYVDPDADPTPRYKVGDVVRSDDTDDVFTVATIEVSSVPSRGAFFYEAADEPGWACDFEDGLTLVTPAPMTAPEPEVELEVKKWGWEPVDIQPKLGERFSDVDVEELADAVAAVLLARSRRSGGRPAW